MHIVIGTPFHPNGAFVFEKFLDNQKSIQQEYSDSELVLATSLPEYVDFLEKKLKLNGLKGKAILYHVIKPEYAKNRIWDIAAGREAIRNYVLSIPFAQGLIFLDADMVFQPNVVSIMLDKRQNNDVLFSGYPMRDWGLALSAFGCVLLSRKILESVKFHCYEFKNGDVLAEDEVLEFDLFRSGFKIKKGIFVSLEHYKNEIEFLHIQPQKVGLLKMLANTTLIRFILVRLSLIMHRNIPNRLRVIIHGKSK